MSEDTNSDVVTWDEVEFEPSSPDSFFDDVNDEDDAEENFGQLVITGADGSTLDLSKPALTYEEAVAITEHIRSTADVLYVLIARAHAGRAWDAMGYTSFASYVKEEFDISKSRAYQLIDQANVVAEITAAAPEGTTINISEAAARDLKHYIEEIAPEIAELTKDVDPDDAGQLIEDLVREYRDKKAGEAADEEEGDDEVDRKGYTGDGSGNGNYDFNSDDDSDDLGDIDDLLQFDEDPSDTRRKFESVYALYTSLGALKDMPPVPEVIAWIPVERRVQVSAALPKVLAWLGAFSEQWDNQPWSQENAASSDDLGAAEEGEFETSEEVEDLFDEFK